MKQFLISILIIFLSLHINGQPVLQDNDQHYEIPPDHIKQGQKWWNLLYYNISILPDYNKKYIEGRNNLTFIALEPGGIMQIDLYEPMKITNVFLNNTNLRFSRSDEYTYLISFPASLKAGQTYTIKIDFKGHPKESVNPPYDNGWIWAKDAKGRPWVSIACEGSGASIWLPCKDVLYDEPDDGAAFSITVPDTLEVVANGRLEKKTVNKNRTATYTWKVINPINNYNIVPYIGKYITWHKDYNGLKGKLDCDFWVLDYNLDKAKAHFKQTDTMLNAFEYWLGPYPFYEDSYKLVEAPMPGMEHQSAVAYGNGFQNGYGGKDFISGSGWGLKWDFMLVHESGHEWFGNSITSNNYGDTWIHEGFTKYLETLYTSYVFGTEAGNDYAIGTWKRIKNDEPILGTNTSDKYYKGSAMLHMIRQIIGDTLFREVLTGLNKEFYHQTVNTNQILAFLNRYTKKNFTSIFDQYLKTIRIPNLSFSCQDNIFQYRWENCVGDFSMPVRVTFDGKNYQFIFPSTQWQTLKTPIENLKNFQVDRNLYITVSENK